jgi:hypothetical protein
MYEFKFKIFKYSCNIYLSNGEASRHHRSIFGVGWLKLVDTKDCLPHPMQWNFGVGCVTTVDTKNWYLVSVDISRHKNVYFYIT